MKLAINSAHTLKGPAHGTIAIKNEAIETRKIITDLKSLISTNDSIELIDCTIDEIHAEEGYIRTISDNVNKSEADLFISVEFNHSSSHLSSGSTIYIKDGAIIDDATCLYKYLETEGFKPKLENGNSIFSFMNIINIKNVIVLKVCYIDNVNDMNTYSSSKIAEILYKSITKNVPSTGWYYQIDTDTLMYYIDSDVCMGIIEIDGEDYYFNDKGALQTGLIVVDDILLYSDIAGKLYKNQWIFYNGGLFYVDGTHKITIPPSVDDILSIDIDGATYTFSKEGCVEYIRSINGDRAMSIFIGSDGNRYPYIEGTETVINNYKLLL